MTGGLLMAFIAFWVIWKDKPMHRKFMLWLSLFFFLMAFYSAWGEQYKAAKDAQKQIADIGDELKDTKRQLVVEMEKTRPNLLGVVNQAFFAEVGPSPDGPSRWGLLYVLLTVRNIGAPSIVENWKLRVQTLATKTSVSFDPIIITDRLYQDPERGGQIRGWLMFELKGYTSAMVKAPGAILTLAYEDVTSKPYEVRIDNTDKGLDIKDSPYFPGTEQPFAPLPVPSPTPAGSPAGNL